MKNVFVVLALIFSSAVIQAQAEKTNTITVTIDNIVNDNGTVLFSLHTQDTFMKGPGIKNEGSTIENGSVTITFTDVAPGEYAIMALHDENDNRRMDFEANGMPKESYGMSGNDMSFGPPSYQAAKFTYEGGTKKLTLMF
ncbi:DUF2141 domain-containing protein [Sediminicola luteus]|uniref:DUF2141 domain-containing protein n=1 Tax=Sediminicola luteus TaxID=319238 RepID=A0A2A4G9M1_9FLAO|nr:DUF2141 domain-containing protein [Sediminicola luteus]PCE64678.1 hypothetical protein B7P33_05765 [Sediminicola luteus]